MSRLAILQMADTPQIESTAVMLRAAGYDRIKVCGAALRRELVRTAGCDTVLAVSQMINLGYDSLDHRYYDGEASPEDMSRADLFVEIKVRNVPKIEAVWPRLRGRTLYWRVNGAQPEICPKGGDEVNLPCPIATACLWYGTERYRWGRDISGQKQSTLEHLASRPVTLQEQSELGTKLILHDTESNSYVFWPPYPRSAAFTQIDRPMVTMGTEGKYDPPFTICHSVRAWGYGPIVDECRKLGVLMYGNGSPGGQVNHSSVPKIVANGKALVHLKSVDCPGWALYEALLAGCPVVTGRLLNSRMLAYSLLEHEETCLEFGVPASLEYGRGDMEYDRCLSDIKEALLRLSNPQENRRIGENGRKRLLSLMWSKDNPDHVRTFREFMGRHFK